MELVSWLPGAHMCLCTCVLCVCVCGHVKNNRTHIWVKRERENERWVCDIRKKRNPCWNECSSCPDSGDIGTLKGAGQQQTMETIVGCAMSRSGLSIRICIATMPNPIVNSFHFQQGFGLSQFSFHLSHFTCRNSLFLCCHCLFLCGRGAGHARTSQRRY